MIVQVHTDPNIQSSPALTSHVEALVAAAVGRFGDRVSRVQVHLGDENSSRKQGSNDKRCMMEVKMDGRPPIAVVQQAATLDQAMTGAADFRKSEVIDAVKALMNPSRPSTPAELPAHRSRAW